MKCFIRLSVQVITSLLGVDICLVNLKSVLCVVYRNTAVLLTIYIKQEGRKFDAAWRLCLEYKYY